MDRVYWTNKIGLTPGKLVLVGVLGCVLVTVVCLQLGARETASSIRSVDRPADSDRPADRVVSQISEPSSEDAAKRRVAAVTRTIEEWPEIPLEIAIAHDPFALPPSLAPTPPEPASDPPAGEQTPGQQDIKLEKVRERALAAVRERGIQMILVNHQNPVAIVGDRIVRVGAVMEGFRVVSISGNGITLSELPVESDAEENGVATQ